MAARETELPIDPPPLEADSLSSRRVIQNRDRFRIGIGFARRSWCASRSFGKLERERIENNFRASVVGVSLFLFL